MGGTLYFLNAEWGMFALSDFQTDFRCCEGWKGEAITQTLHKLNSALQEKETYTRLLIKAREGPPQKLDWGLGHWDPGKVISDKKSGKSWRRSLFGGRQSDFHPLLVSLGQWCSKWHASKPPGEFVKNANSRSRPWSWGSRVSSGKSRNTPSVLAPRHFWACAWRNAASLCPYAAQRAREGAILLHEGLSILLWMPFAIHPEPDFDSIYSHSSLHSPLLSAAFIPLILSFISSTCASAVLGAGRTEEQAIKGPCFCKYPKVKIPKGQPVGFCWNNWSEEGQKVFRLHSFHCSSRSMVVPPAHSFVYSFWAN